ncbi:MULTISPECIES: hypothetical protein [Fructobacillus]|jgi:HD-GYP domain-containing protein (c-di-GMP phosphodiesterase class II)|uniref:Uncharacterized protein n=1 Tax=Fructobacillus cardui TaxID=2893170 RepID=A0ABM9N0U3_9LACO|nr:MULTISPECIES: hypothetical protein [Fructobacillus]KMK53509.1 hypothetical protein FEFB_07000 [Fructobacillus sp. EFB-N1]MCK8627438.1 hypothetical protein [Fructobacillus cardui]CAK1233789.1 hypothetical protein R82265_HNDDMDAM_00428 [Fructobacillus cardui]CAK1242473.1 hypothetical protein R82291_FJPPFKPJ_01251 [Fructobacillus cardui]CAK1253021.1 hypothetical protein R82641_BJNNKPBH_01387 [Fructobacillus cardui]
MDFAQALSDLKDGKINHFDVDPETFPAFQKAWSAFPYQNTVKGIAQRAGKVTYIQAK